MLFMLAADDVVWPVVAQCCGIIFASSMAENSIYHGTIFHRLFMWLCFLWVCISTWSTDAQHTHYVDCMWFSLYANMYTPTNSTPWRAHTHTCTQIFAALRCRVAARLACACPLYYYANDIIALCRACPPPARCWPLLRLTKPISMWPASIQNRREHHTTSTRNTGVLIICGSVCCSHYIK